MSVKQISVFLENKKGRLADVTRLLTREKINIRALSLADTADFGVLRLIVNDPEACVEVLKAHQFVAQPTEVVAVEVPDRPGGLNGILEVFDTQGVNVEYMYGFVEKKVENAILVFRVEEQAKALDALKASGIRVLSEEMIRAL
jgi:hypothetical protein